MRLTHSIVFAAVSLVIATLQSPAQAATLGHTQAVNAARAGQYDEALGTLQRLVQQNPKNLQYRYDWIAVLSWAAGNLGTKTGLMYSHLEAENFASTEGVVQDLMHQTNNAIGTRRTQASVMRFADRLEEADVATQMLMAELPNDAGIWLARADLLASRGLPRAASKLYADVLAVEPDHIGARVGLTNATWAQGDIVAAAEMVKALEAEAPEHPAVRRLVRDWQRKQRPLFVTTVTKGYGQGRVSGNDDMTWESVLYSGQTDDGIRVFATQHSAQAKFNDESARHARLGTGRSLDTLRCGSASLSI